MKTSKSSWELRHRRPGLDFCLYCPIFFRVGDQWYTLNSAHEVRTYSPDPTVDKDMLTLTHSCGDCYRKAICFLAARKLCE